MSTESLESQYRLALPPATIIAERYALERAAASAASPYAITYDAIDCESDRELLVKEFFPRGLVGRAADGVTAVPHSPEDARDFHRALRRFANEGSALADIAHPGVVDVRQIAEAHGTAYLVMDRMRTTSIDAHLAAHGGRLTVRDALAFGQQLAAGLERIHAEGIVHRDLSPRSVAITADGQPVIVGFSARRHVAGQSAELVPGFAAFEQYGAKEVGPWTDVYSAAALIYLVLTGQTPPCALDRAAGDALVVPGVVAPETSPSMAMLLVRALSLLPPQRPHSASEFKRLLDASAADSARVQATQASLAAARDLSGRELLTRGPGDHGDAGDDRALRFGDGGIIVPGEEPTAARFLRAIGGATQRLRNLAPRREDRRDEDETAFLRLASAPSPSVAPFPVADAAPRAVSPASPPGHAAGAADDRVVESSDVATTEADDEAAAAHAEPTVAVAETQTAVREPVVAPPLTLQPATTLVPVGGLAPAAALEPVTSNAGVTVPVLDSEFVYHEPTRGGARLKVAGIAAVAILSVGAAAWAMSGTRSARTAEVAQGDADLSAAAASRSPSPGNGAIPAAAAPAAAPSGAARVALADSSTHREPTPDLPGSTTRERRDPPHEEARTPLAAIQAPALTLNLPTSAELRLVPADVMAGLRGRLAGGSELADQGDYAVARRSFREGLQEIDSAITTYPTSDALRALRQRFEAADARARQACDAENALRRARNESLGTCQ